MVWRTIQPRPVASTGGTPLPPGSYLNQPLVWDGSAWVPSGGSVAVSTLYGENGNVTMFLSLPEPVPGFSTISNWTVDSANIAQAERDNIAGLNRFTIVGQTLNPLVLEAYDAGPPRFGALGATPVPRQSITGVTTQDQVDSLVAALVALGFVTDDR